MLTRSLSALLSSSDHWLVVAPLIPCPPLPSPHLQSGRGHGNLERFQAWAKAGQWRRFGPSHSHYDWYGVSCARVCIGGGGNGGGG